MKRFSKIFAVVMAIAMLTSVFCFQSSAVIADSSVDVNVKLVEDSMTSVQQEEPTDNGFYFPFGN